LNSPERDRQGRIANMRYTTPNSKEVEEGEFHAWQPVVAGITDLVQSRWNTTTADEHATIDENVFGAERLIRMILRRPQAEGHCHLRSQRQPSEPHGRCCPRCRLQRLETIQQADPLHCPSLCCHVLRHGVGHSPVWALEVTQGGVFTRANC
jgi:hypothetical protein